MISKFKKSLLASLVATLPTCSMFAQISNPSAPTTPGIGLSRTGTALNVLYGSTAHTAIEGNAVISPAQGGTGATGFVQNGTGAISRTWTSKNQDIYSVKDFGVLCDGSTDDLANINAAILAVNAAGGGILNFPAGTCVASSTITNLPYVTLNGAGMNSTIILVSGTGDGMQMLSPINASTDVFAAVKNLQIKNTNGANVGAGYTDVGGHFINFEDVEISGFGFGIILDQSELVTVRRAYFDTQLIASLWLVNGPDHTPTALGEFTNRITVQESNFSGHVVCVADDGGIAHTYLNNNFEGCSNSFRLADQILFAAEYNEFENSTAENFITSTTSFTGLPLANSTSISVRNNQASVPSTFNFFKTVAGIGQLDVSGNVLSNSLAASVDLGTGLVGNFTSLPANYNFASSNYQTGTATTYLSLLNGYYRLKDLQIENQIVMDAGNAKIINGFGSDAITWTSTSSHGAINVSTNSVTRLGISDTGIAVTGVAAVTSGSGNAVVAVDGASTQGSVQLSNSVATYVMHGGVDYGGIDYRVPTGNEHIFRVNGTIVGDINGTKAYTSVPLAVGSATLNTSPAAEFQVNGSGGAFFCRTNGTECYYTVAGDFYFGGIGAGSKGHLYASNADILDFDSAGIYNGGTANLLFGIAAPTISSGFGTSPSIVSHNGASTFRVNVGTGGTANSGVIGLPTATAGWNCRAGIFNPSATNLLSQTIETASTVNSVTLQNDLTSTGTPTAWPASTVLMVDCLAY